MNRKELKEKAQNSLKGKYKDAIIMMVLMYVISFAIGAVVGLIGGILNLNESMMDLFSSGASIVLSGLLMFGYTSYFLKISRNEEVTYNELFSKTHLLVPYILITLLTAVLVFCWSLLFVIPGIIAGISYSLVYFIALDNPELKTSEVLKKSKNMMNGHKLDYFILQLSFIGWAILGIFTLGILYLWLIPYMQVTIANFYNQLKEQN